MILQSKRVWIINDWLMAQVEISAQSGRIEGIYPYGTKQVDLDLGNMRVVPGFIDVHTHGAYGFDTNDGDEAGLRRLGAGRPAPVQHSCRYFDPVAHSAVAASADFLPGAAAGTLFLWMEAAGFFPFGHRLSQPSFAFDRQDIYLRGPGIFQQGTAVPQSDRDEYQCLD